MPDADVNLGALTDSNIASGAAIALNKLAALTASRAVVSDGSGVLSSSSVTSTELGYVSGVTSAIQTQLNSKQAASSNLDAIAAVATNGGLHRTGAGTYAARTLTGTTNEIDVANGDGVSGNPTVGLADNPVIPGTDSMVVPSGTTAQRVSTTNGAFRFNSELSRFEGYKSGAWGEIGGGAGGINYIDDNDAEAGVGDWATYADAAGENAVDGTGGAATLTFTQNATTALRGSNDFKFAKDAANRQGEGASYDFSIDNADKSQKLYIGFDYDASDANYADDDIRIAVYDVTNATLIRVNGEDLKGGKGKYLGWFQSAADSTSYRLIIHQSSTNATAYDIFFDNISVGPREVSYGSAMTDWKEYTPTFQGLGTVTNINFYYRRIGSDLQIRGTYTTGTVTSSEARVSMPLGLISSSEISALEYARGGHYRSSTTATFDSLMLIKPSVDYLNYGIQGSATSGLVVRSGTESHVSSTNYSISASVPIKGWSSNSIQSEDIGNREIRVRGAGNGGTSITANTTNVDFTEVEDTTASWNGSQFTAPETGDYSIVGQVRITTGQSIAIEAYVNGSSVKGIGYQFSASVLHPFSGTISLQKGDTLSLRSSGNVTLSNTSPISHHIHIQKLAQPQTLLETETVSARYTSSSGQAAGGILEYEEKVFDTHNAYNTTTGEYTIPISGYYSISTRFLLTGLTPNSGVVESYIYNNGSVVEADYNEINGTGLCGANAVIQSIYLAKGDVITLRGIHTNGGTKNLITSSEYNTFSIARIK